MLEATAYEWNMFITLEKNSPIVHLYFKYSRIARTVEECDMTDVTL